MTTAARPTWAPAKGGEEQGGSRMFGPSKHYSSRDMAAHTKLKPRRDGQNTEEDLRKRDLIGELEEKERKHQSTKDKEREVAEGRKRGAVSAFLEGSVQVEDKLIPKPVDADDSDGEPANDQEDDDDDENDDDEDDTAELLAELERIKKERAEEKARKEKERAEQESKQREADMAVGNPLLSTGGTVGAGGSFSVKRRWDDDVVFRNQAKGEQSKAPKRFINDTIRSDFHRRFLNKYMK